jgi:hypothetical protein
MGILRTNTVSGIGTDGPVFDGVTRLDTFGYVVPPVGVTSDRTLVGVTTAQGAIRFNTDSQKLEFFAQDQWFEMVIDTPALGVGSNTGAGARGVFGGGIEAGNVNTIEYINVSSTGNATDFGDLVSARDSINSASSSTRGLFCGGGPSTNIIEYITISSTGNTQDFGDMTRVTGHQFTTSNATRALNAGGPEGASPSNIIDYVTIASTGNAVDFGDLTIARWGAGGGRSNSTRALFLGGHLSPSTGYNTIDFVTISTLGNAQDFGDALYGQYGSGAGNSSSKIRAFIAGGSSTIGPTPGGNNVIQTVLFMTLGNATDFGDLSRYVRGTGSLSDSTRGVYGGGAPGYMNIIDYFLMSQSGNAVDFGDLSANRAFNPAGLSNAHGGL